MKITGHWLAERGLQSILECLNADGHRAYLVGGCVRNALLGLPIDDVDIATDAEPTIVQRLCVAQGHKVVPTGIDHGTVTVVADGRGHEVTTFRQDVETDGRRAVIAYSSDIRQDAARRDFTMNALYADAKGQVIDPLGGLPDLIARRVRFVGDAAQRIREDYLRILRFFRFFAVYGDHSLGLDPDGLAACAANIAGIETLSRERLGHEVRKMLTAADPAPAVAAMQASGILAAVLPGADARALAPLVHLEAGLRPSPMRRLAALAAENPAEALRLSRHEANMLEKLREGVGSDVEAAELAYRMGADLAHDVLLLRAAMTGTSLQIGWDSDVSKGANAVFPLRAADLPAHLKGPEIGKRLRALEQRWIASGFELSREQLLA